MTTTHTAHIKRVQTMTRRIRRTQLDAALLLAESMKQAVRTLSGLMDVENGEIARKACVDVIKLQSEVAPVDNDEPSVAGPLDPALADRLLSVLADEAP